MSVVVKPEQLLPVVPDTAGDIFRMIGVTNAGPRADAIRFNPEHVPFKFQVSVLRSTIKHTRYGLYDETGVGKTLPSQLLLLLNACLGNRGVIIMPPNLIEQYIQSFASTFIGVTDHFVLAQMPRGPAVRVAQVEAWTRDGWPDVLLMSYAMFLKTWMILESAGYDAMVADEAQNLSNPGSKTSAAFHRFIGKVGEKYVLPMTGTPAHNQLTDLYGQIKITSPDIYRTKKAFEDTHCIFAKVNSEKLLIGYKNRELLSQNLFARGRRVRKEQVYDMEKPSVTEVPFELYKPHKALYDKLNKERVLEIGDELIDATNASSLRQKAQRIVLNPEAFSDKKLANAALDTLDDLLDTINPRQEKVVIVANFQESVILLSKHYCKFNPALAYGKSDSAKAREKFLNDPTCRMIIMHPKSGGVGFNLQSVCRYVIFAEPVSVPGDFKQCLDRVHRPGQDKHVSCYVLKAMGTIFPSLIHNMLAKEGEVKRIARDRNSVMDELMGVVPEARKAA